MIIIEYLLGEVHDISKKSPDIHNEITLLSNLLQIIIHLFHYSKYKQVLS